MSEQSRSAWDRVRTITVFRAVLAVLGRPAQLSALALAVALGIPCAILFTSNGLRAVDVVALVQRSFAARGSLWLGWLVLSMPALRVLFEAPGTRSLRSLRLPRAPLLAALSLLALSIELPWGVLFLRGGGIVQAWAVLALSICAAGFAHAGLCKPRWLGALAATLAVLALFPPSLALALGASLVAPLALARAWALVPEQPGLRFRAIVPTHPFIALYLAHVLRLLRVARSRLMVALAAGLSGAIGLVFSLQNDPTTRPIARALAALCLPLTLAAAVCVAPIAESEARLRMQLRSLRVPRSLVLGAFLCAIATPSSALAATTSVAASGAAHTSLAWLTLALLGWAWALSAAVALWGRLLEARSRRSAGVFAAGVTLIAALGLVGASAW